jgi:hypothetical protein
MKGFALWAVVLSGLCFPAFAQHATGNDSPVPGAGLPLIAIGLLVYFRPARDSSAFDLLRLLGALGFSAIAVASIWSSKLIADVNRIGRGLLCCGAGRNKYATISEPLGYIMRLFLLFVIFAASSLAGILETTAANDVAQCLNQQELPERTSTDWLPKGECPIKQGNLCFDRNYRVAVSNSCDRPIKIHVDAGRSPSAGDYPLAAHSTKTYGCLQVTHSCSKIKVTALKFDDSAPPSQQQPGNKTPNASPPENLVPKTKSSLQNDARTITVCSADTQSCMTKCINDGSNDSVECMHSCFSSDTQNNGYCFKKLR